MTFLMVLNFSKKILALIFSLFVIVHLNAQNLPAKPTPPKLVNDFAKILSTAEQTSLETKLVAYDDSTSTQIAIVTLATVDGSPIAEFAHDLLTTWGIGQSKKDNGILILVTTEPKNREIAIAVGYGLEPYITDALSKRIIETELIPRFKQEKYFEGLDAATDVLIAYAQGNFSNNKSLKKKDNAYSGGWMPSWVFIFMIIILIILFSNNSKGKKGSGYNKTFGGPSNLGGFRNFSSGSGVFKNTGSFGGRSSGGFGGFGGGRSGGGGASGRW